MVSSTEVIIALAIGYLVYSVFGLRRYIRLCRLVKDFSQPGPAHPIWGHLRLDAKSLMPGEKDTVIVGKRPKMFVNWLSFIPLISTIHPETTRILLESSNNKPSGRGQIYSVFKLFLGEGLFISNGKKWERNRKLLKPVFHSDVLRPHVTIYNEAADLLLGKYADKMAEGPDSIEVTGALNQAWLDVILRCSMSYEGHLQERDNHPYAAAVQEISKSILARTKNPLYFFSWTLFTLSSPGKAFVKNVKFIHQFTEDLISKRKQELKEDPLSLKTRRSDFMDILISAKDENGDSLSITEIRDELDSFMFAAHGATLGTMQWAIYNLGKYPEEQEKVYQEVSEVVGDKKHVEWEDLNKLPRLEMFLKESLRMYTPGHSINRLLEEDVTLDGVVIPAGTALNINILYMHRNNAVFTDAKEFRPERFLPENSAERDPFAFIPFSASSRYCIGKQYAMNWLLVFLSRLIQRFRIVLDKDHPITPALELIFKPQYGVKVRFEER